MAIEQQGAADHGAPNVMSLYRPRPLRSQHKKTEDGGHHQPEKNKDANEQAAHGYFLPTVFLAGSAA